MSKRSHGEYVETPTGSKKARVNVNTKSTETLEGALGNLSTAHSSLEKLVTEDLWKRDRPLDESIKLKEILEQAKTALVKSATFLTTKTVIFDSSTVGLLASTCGTRLISLNFTPPRHYRSTYNSPSANMRNMDSSTKIIKYSY